MGWFNGVTVCRVNVGPPLVECWQDNSGVRLYVLRLHCSVFCLHYIETRTGSHLPAFDGFVRICISFASDWTICIGGRMVAAYREGTDTYSSGHMHVTL